MSAYNEEKYIAEAIDSILKQTYEDFEFIIINDGSTDGTMNVIKRFDDPRLVIVENPVNIGLTKSLNKGLDIAQGKLIARMDANDVSAKTRFEKQVAVFQSCVDVDLVWTGAVYITDNGEYLCPKITPSFQDTIELLVSSQDNFPVGRNHVNHMTVMFKKNAVLKLGGYFEKYKWGQDGNLWCRMLRDGARFYFLEEPLMCIRLLVNSVTARRIEYPMDKNEYYSSICLINKYYIQALRYALKMSWSFQKLRRLMIIKIRLLMNLLKVK